MAQKGNFQKCKRLDGWNVASLKRIDTKIYGASNRKAPSPVSVCTYQDSRDPVDLFVLAKSLLTSWPSC